MVVLIYCFLACTGHGSPLCDRYFLLVGIVAERREKIAAIKYVVGNDRMIEDCFDL